MKEYKRKDAGLKKKENSKAIFQYSFDDSL